MDEQLQELDRLTAELLKVGESSDDLAMWRSLYPILDASEQEKLLNNLRTELSALTKIRTQ